MNRRTVTRIIIFFTFLICGHSSDEIFTQLGQCCNEGLKWASESNHCADFDYAIDKIPNVWRGLCLSTFGICCSKELATQHCAAGRAAAKDGSNCDGSKQFNTTSYKDCCQACQIGLAVAASSNNCSSHLLSYLSHDESYEICCNEINSDTFILSENDDICGKFKKLCSHICENTDDSYVCKCPPGMKLDDNRVTCTPIITKMENVDHHHHLHDDDDDDDDESEENEENDEPCPDGHVRNDNTHTCDDIDECLLDQEKCNTDQYCYNTVGSYTCLNIRSTECQDGFRFNTKTEECEDIDECLEENHDCKHPYQICTNTIGGFTCQNKPFTKCMPGFIYIPETRKCEDFDECLENPCEEGFSCLNLPGNYECRKIITSTMRDRQTAPGHHLLPPVMEQKCGPGYRYKHNKCIDIDECLTDKNACDSNQLCTNEQGGYKCECKIGFKMDTTLNACIDINECQINNHNCLPTQRCDNTIGSYTCIRLQSCGTGYTLNAETSNCDDDDECELGSHDCPTGYECRNTMGSFRCDRIRLTTRRTTKSTSAPTTTTTTTTTQSTANVPTSSSGQTNNRTTRIFTSSPEYRNNSAYYSSQTYSHLTSEYVQTSTQRFRPDPSCGYGFQRNHLGACVDIDECQIPNTCGSHQKCLNTNGSYRCQNLLLCSGGYKSTPDGTTCVDIDECQTGEHNCGPDQICRNRMGGYICSCPPGHLPNTFNRCEDINECEFQREQVCPINSNCINTVGSYICDCKPGFKKQKESDKACIDIDECDEIQGLCEQKCINFWGSYRCACNPGYEINSDNRTCNDVDECEVHKSYNLCQGHCNNVPGSYECSCPSGYELGTDKNSCRDVDECALPQVCTGRNEICTNIRGSYRCSTINCPYGYSIDPDQKNRCRAVTNICEGEECFQKPSSYTYNFITLVSKMLIPPQGRTLFTLRGPAWYENIDFDLKIAKIQAPPEVERATDQHFSTTKLQNQVQLSLMRSLEGPQDIELELSMTVFMHGQPRGRSIAKIIIIVSQHTF